MGTCMSRLRQSPISIDRLLKTPPSYFADFKYDVINDPLVLKAQSGMLTVDLTQKMYGGVVYNQELYQITKIDIHGPAEHLIQGYQNTLEIQLVHRKADNPLNWLIVSILVWCEDPPPPPNISNASIWKTPANDEVDFNENLQKFLTQEVPYVDGAEAVIPPQALDLNLLVRNPLVNRSGEYINYRGSLTEPPCLDSTTWFVRRQTAVASISQVGALQNALYRLTGGDGSFRSIMPMNHRFLKVFELRHRMNLTESAYTMMPWSANPRTDGEMEATKLARIAKAKAEHAAYYAEGFARRLRNADLAWAKNLKGEALSAADAWADGEAHRRADREADYQQSVRRVRAAVQNAARDVQQTIDEGFAKEVTDLALKGSAESAKANALFNR